MTGSLTPAASMTVRVIAVADPAPGIREVTLVRPDGSALPSFVPGSSVLVTPAGVGTEAVSVVRSYSLIGPSFEPSTYVIAVRAIGAGSLRIHRLAVGDRLEISVPRSGFAPVAAAPDHLLIAGGIGVTPILSHARWHSEIGNRFGALYVHRQDSAAYLDDLAELAGERFCSRVGRRGLDDAVADMIERAHPRAHLYLCGPEGFVAAISTIATAMGVPSARVHSELFVVAQRPSEPFVVHLRDSGRSIEVSAESTLLGALEDAGVVVDSQCRRGVCGRCRIVVADGAIDHRDLYLSERDRAGGAVMMPCVSRAVGPELVVAV